jgi:hypothetical protein
MGTFDLEPRSVRRSRSSAHARARGNRLRRNVAQGAIGPALQRCAGNSTSASASSARRSSRSANRVQDEAAAQLDGGGGISSIARSSRRRSRWSAT